jgi:membrane-bound metal-dependent hydrolase YbcI (DUF457 family)
MALLLPRFVLVAAVAWIFVADDILLSLRLPVPLVAFLDEGAHVATAGLLLANTRLPWTRAFVLGALLSSVLIDLDHVPQLFFSSDALTAGAPRPYSHSLATPLLALLLAAAVSGRRRDAAIGLCVGVASHVFRDLAVGPGVALLWPFSTAAVQIPYFVYAAVVLGLLARAWPRASHRTVQVGADTTPVTVPGTDGGPTGTRPGG